MDIIIDSREPLAIQNDMRSRFPTSHVASLGSSSGDLLAILDNGSMIIERKETPNDLLGSIADSRIFAQCEQIPRLCRFPFLVLDGALRYSDNDKVMVTRNGLGWTESNWRKSSIEMALFRCQAMGMMLIRDDDAIVKNCKSYPDKVQRLIDWCSTADALHINRRSLIVNPFEPQQAQLDFLASLPGVGVERAKSLIEFYPDAPLYVLVLYAINGFEKSNHPKLWGSKSVAMIREFLQIPENVKLIQTEEQK